MNLFEQTIEAVLLNNQNYYNLRPAVEKEILHQDFLRTLGKAGVLRKLSFMGGTCLRTCYGFSRISEDLDFTGGFDFKKDDLADIGALIKNVIQQKYYLKVKVMKPVKEEGNTHTWKINIITAPERPDLPQQKINIDVCTLPSYERRPAMIKNHYGLDSGTSGLIIMTESLNEIFADKLIAVAFRPNRVKYRDIWDIYQLKFNNAVLSQELLKQKLIDRKINFSDFQHCFNERIKYLQTRQHEFLYEMQRFLIIESENNEIKEKQWWNNIIFLLEEWGSKIKQKKKKPLKEYSIIEKKHKIS